MVFVLFAIVGLLSGIVGALIGLGGGIVLVPSLLFLGSAFAFFPELSPQNVVGLSVVMMVFTGLSSTLAYMKVRTVDYRSGIIFFIGSAPGTVIGALVNRNLDIPSFNLYFGILLVFLSILLIVRNKLKPVRWFVEHGRTYHFTDHMKKEYIYGYPIWFALLLTFLVGFSSGLFGIGGGSILVPAMILLFLFPPHVAVATSMFMVFLSALVNSATHISLGNIPWLYTIPVIPAAYIGAKIGAFLNRKMDSELLVTVLRISLLVIGLRLIYEGIFSS